eukprot:6603273-Karenia_brevis.AAC.1
MSHRSWSASQDWSAGQDAADQIVPNGKGGGRDARPCQGAQPNQAEHNPNTPFQPPHPPETS